MTHESAVASTQALCRLMFAAVVKETVHVAYFSEFDVMGARKLSFVYIKSRKVRRIRATISSFPPFICYTDDNGFELFLAESIELTLQGICFVCRLVLSAFYSCQFWLCLIINMAFKANLLLEKRTCVVDSAYCGPGKLELLCLFLIKSPKYSCVFIVGLSDTFYDFI